MATFERMLLARKHVIIAEKYNVIRKIGGGSFGDIFLAININDGEVNNVSYLAISIDLHSCMTTSCVNCPCISGFCARKWRSWCILNLIITYRKDIVPLTVRYCSICEL